jgi:hypothetical protein
VEGSPSTVHPQNGTMRSIDWCVLATLTVAEPKMLAKNRKGGGAMRGPAPSRCFRASCAALLLALLFGKFAFVYVDGIENYMNDAPVGIAAKQQFPEPGHADQSRTAAGARRGLLS